MNKAVGLLVRPRRCGLDISRSDRSRMTSRPHCPGFRAPPLVDEVVRAGERHGHAYGASPRIISFEVAGERCAHREPRTRPQGRRRRRRVWNWPAHTMRVNFVHDVDLHRESESCPRASANEVFVREEPDPRHRVHDPPAMSARDGNLWPTGSGLLRSCGAGGVSTCNVCDGSAIFVPAWNQLGQAEEQLFLNIQIMSPSRERKRMQRRHAPTRKNRTRMEWPSTEGWSASNPRMLSTKARSCSEVVSKRSPTIG